MCYWFEQGGHYMRCEVHRVDGQYELVIVSPDGTVCVERYAHSDAVHSRQRELQQSLIGGGWSGPHGRHI